MFTLYYRGKALPNDPNDQPGYAKLSSDPELRDQLRTLWCAADAVISGDEHLFVDKPLHELLACIDPEFLEAAGPEFAFLPGFIQDHRYELRLVVVAA